MQSTKSYHISDDILAKNRQVFSHIVDGQRVWVKKRRPNKNPLGWWTQKTLFALTGNILLLPPNRPTGNNVSFEAGRLRQLAALGVPVPEVLFVTDDYFVMAEVGMTLDQYLREHRDDRELQDQIIRTAIEELRRFHDHGFAHGGAQIKNLMVHDGSIYFIDFEENIPEEKRRLFQVRDVFLFLLSLERAGHDPDIEALCRIYDPVNGDDLYREIRSAVSRFRLVRLSRWRVFNRLSMRDIRTMCRFVDKVDSRRTRSSLHGNS